MANMKLHLSFFVLLVVRYSSSTLIACDQNDYEHFHCHNRGACILMTRRCDGFNDCGDNSDETGCAGIERKRSEIMNQNGLSQCSFNRFRCSYYESCLPIAQLCDGHSDCRGGRDESNCLTLKAMLSPDHFPGWILPTTPRPMPPNNWNNCQGRIGSYDYVLQLTAEFTDPFRGVSFSQTCTGTLINPRWVLTSVTCIYSAGVFANRIVVDGSGRQAVLTNHRYAKHPKYNENTGDYNIGLVELDHAARSVFQDIVPVCLPSQSTCGATYTNGQSTSYTDGCSMGISLARGYGQCKFSICMKIVLILICDVCRCWPNFESTNHFDRFRSMSSKH